MSPMTFHFGNLNFGFPKFVYIGVYCTTVDKYNFRGCRVDNKKVKMFTKCEMIIEMYKSYHIILNIPMYIFFLCQIALSICRTVWNGNI